MTPLKISLEFTSPSHPIAENNIFNGAAQLSQYPIDYSVVNFGGDTISPERAIMIMSKLDKNFNMPTIGYLRRLHIDRNLFNSLAIKYYDLGMQKIFLTQGRRHSLSPISTENYKTLTEAVSALKAIANFRICVEARPEDASEEVDEIKKLIDLGVDEIVTRFTFTPSITIRFLEKLFDKSILPKIRIGMIAIENPSKTFLTAHRLNVSIPDHLSKIFTNYPDDDTINANLGTYLFIEQIKEYMNSGFFNFHIRYGKSSLPIQTMLRYFNYPIIITKDKDLEKLDVMAS